jgi:hypothetical protein
VDEGFGIVPVVGADRGQVGTIPAEAEVGHASAVETVQTDHQIFGRLRLGGTAVKSLVGTIREEGLRFRGGWDIR